VIVKEIGRILVSVILLALAGFLFYCGVNFPEPAQALGAVAVGGTIIGAILTYWLKP
jgi:hypothetical protein